MQASKLLKINHDICLKCGGCVATYPDIFEFGENQKILVKESADVEPKDISEIKAVCPVAAIIDK